MKLSQYLHKDIVDVLKTFGNLSDVVNKILDAADEGLIEIENKPVCRDREGCGRYDIHIRNENYINMLQIYGIKSKTISLRRLIYWFVENEIYNDLGWEQIKEYIDDDDAKLNKCLDKVLNDLDRLLIICKHDNIIQAKELILTLKGE